MPMFMAQFSYTPGTWAALIHAPQDRAAASDALVRHFGGRLIGLYYTPGAEYDGFALFEAPDDAAAAAVEIADVALGHLRNNRLLRVLSLRGDACRSTAGGHGAEHRSKGRQLKRLAAAICPSDSVIAPIVTIRRSVIAVHRIVALALAFVWLGASAAGIALGVVQGRWLFAVIAVFALWHAILWFRVVARARLLTLSELVAPWPRRDR